MNKICDSCSELRVVLLHAPAAQEVAITLKDFGKRMKTMQVSERRRVQVGKTKAAERILRTLEAQHERFSQPFQAATAPLQNGVNPQDRDQARLLSLSQCPKLSCSKLPSSTKS